MVVIGRRLFNDCLNFNYTLFVSSHFRVAFYMTRITRGLFQPFSQRGRVSRGLDLDSIRSGECAPADAENDPNAHERFAALQLWESQRDSVSKPGVARNELPWEKIGEVKQPQRGCGPL
jgi:hypothetical protein